jgi:hypothetical protein
VKVTRVGPDEIFHRYLTPKWAFHARSGLLTQRFISISLTR